MESRKETTNGNKENRSRPPRRGNPHLHPGGRHDRCRHRYADPTTAATITVNGDVAGHTFKAYKIATYGNVQIDGNGAAKLTLTSTDQAKITAAAQSVGITVASGQDPIDAVTRNASAAQVKAFAKALAASGIAQTGQTTTGSGKTATIGNLTEAGISLPIPRACRSSSAPRRPPTARPRPRWPTATRSAPSTSSPRV